MKKLIYVVLCGFMMLNTGCIDIIEEIFLKKDGSGKYLFTMDLSAMMDEDLQNMMKGFGEEAEEGEEAAEAETGGEDAFKDVMFKESMDTIMYFSDAPDSIKQNFDDPEMLKKMFMHIKSDVEEKKMFFSFGIDFDKPEEIEYLMKNLDKLQQANQMGGSMGMGNGFMMGSGSSPSFVFKKKYLERLPVKKGDVKKAIGEEDMGVMKMIFGSASYKTIYHLPGKVKKVSNSKAVIDGKTVTLTMPMMDYLEELIDPATSIKFKNR